MILVTVTSAVLGVGCHTHGHIVSSIIVRLYGTSPWPFLKLIFIVIDVFHYTSQQLMFEAMDGVPLLHELICVPIVQGSR